MSAMAACAKKGCEVAGVQIEVEDTSLATFCGTCGTRLKVPGEAKDVNAEFVVYEAEADTATMLMAGVVPDVPNKASS